MDRGIVYVATAEDRAVEAAFLSADSAKWQAPGLHITLFTDRPAHPLVQGGPFDRVETCAAGDNLARTPYERTLYLDNATRILSRALPEVFAVLDKHEAARTKREGVLVFRRGAVVAHADVVLDEAWNATGGDRINILKAASLYENTLADLLAVAAAKDDPRLYDYVAAQKPVRQLRAYWPLALTSGKAGDEWASEALKRADVHINHGQERQAAGILGGIAAPNLRAQVLTGRARLVLAGGAMADALTLTTQARAIAPGSSYVAIIHGAALLAAGKAKEAIGPLSEAAKERPGAHFLLGLAAQRLEDFAGAAAAYRKGHAFDATDPGPANNLLPMLLADRKYDEAVAHADSLLAARPGHTTSLAFKSMALGELGRVDDLKALADLDGKVVAEDLPVPAGYPDRATFHRALVREIADDPSLAYERNTTRFGYQTDDIAHAGGPAIKALNAMLEQVVRRRAQAPKDFRLYSWGVIMNDQGHQAAHFHPHGWLSGVYYIDVPAEISESDPDKRGWIEFGRGDERWHRKNTAMPTRQVLPKAGVLLTFPSFFWHSTRPLRSQGQRVSFAFDVIPA